MKNILKHISLCLIAVVGLSSCEPDDNGYRDDNRDVGGYAHLQTRSLTIFDFDQDLNIAIYTGEGVTVESVEIVHDGSVISTADVSGETATFNASDLGDFEAGDSFPVIVRTNLSNGEVSEEPATISIGNAVALGDDNLEEAPINMLDEVELEYSVNTSTAPIDEVNLWIKNGEDAEYIMIDTELDTESGSVSMGDIDYSGLNLEVGDIIFYQFAATRGDLTEGAEGEIEVLEAAEEENGEGDGNDNDGSDGDDSDEDDSDGDDSDEDGSDEDDSDDDDSDDDES